MRPLLSFTYSQALAEHLNAGQPATLSQDDMRRESARIIRPEDVDAVDRRLIRFVEENRINTHIIIDSHAVTKEKFGFRVTPFASDRLLAVKPTMIFMLYATAAVVQERIAAESQGRPQVSPQEADLHTYLQASVAITYSVQAGVPLYLLDSSAPTEELAEQIIRRL